MKKNANILEYVEKYKYKYGIKYAEDGGKLVKTLGVLTAIVWVYLFFMLALSIISNAINYSNLPNFEDVFSKNALINTVISAVVMIIAAAFFVCKQKIIGCVIAIIIQPLIIFVYSVEWAYGLGYLTRFYVSFLAPSLLLIIFAAFLAIVLIRAKVKTNKIYNTLIEGLYKQYGTKDGEKLTDEQWNEFLTNYNPYKIVD